ncbi:MAG: alkaline phosphatase family protein [Kiritimatiellae bacterium]|nr:alkaline phosphatase family protein [Kiritimatiellia bacterium]
MKATRAKGKRCSRREFLRMTGACAVLASVGFPAISSARPRVRSVIVLGIDGMDPNLLLRFVAQGLMPNAQRLMEIGCFAPLGTSDPPQSPVAWSNFISGTNPGGHGIFDFIARDPATLAPYLSTSRVQQGSLNVRVGHHLFPLSKSRVVNLRRGPTLWKELESRGIDCVVVRMPANFPPTPTRARTLSGLGTPDLRGGYGIFSFYTDSPEETSREVSGGQIHRITISANQAECIIAGPANPFRAEYEMGKVAFTVIVDPINPAVLVRVQGTAFILREGQWSDWIPVRFPLLGRVISAPGICRFYLKSARNPFALYVSPVNIDPEEPWVPISTPPSYSRELAIRLGRFHTQGMAEDTKALSARVFSDDEYRQQAEHVLDESLRSFELELGRFRRGFFFHYFSSLDLNSHAFWRTIDPQHPLYSPELAERQGDFLPRLYSQMDRAIGEAMRCVDDQTVLMVVSDHGFGSFRRQVNVNSWLMDNGYAVAIDRFSRGSADYFGDISWPKTRAYGLGINSLYLNLKGREPDGIVEPGDEKERLLRELAMRLKEWRDPKTGGPVLKNVYRPEEIYSGPYLNEAPDLILGFAPTYRASWDTILGRYPREHILDNTDPWSGDHALDSSFMAGTLLCNRKVTVNDPTLSDLAPTILALWGVPVPRAMTGRNIM